MSEKTIAAISTGAAPGGIGIVRISGDDAITIAERVVRSKSGRSISELKGYSALLGEAYTAEGEKLDDVVALVFRAPRSYTGETVVELSCHGGLYVTRRLLRTVLEAGAAPAGPGEFTRRAFLNGKLDLTRAESVMALIGAGGEEAARIGAAAGSGALFSRIGSIRDILTDLAAHLAAWADFPEEDVPQLEESRFLEQLSQVEGQLTNLLATFDMGKIYREGVETVIAGKPNAGKSTLMNLLSGCEKSIVTQFAGTTRDVVEETVLLGEILLRLADTAGLRETDDPVEQIGVQAAQKRLQTAQLVLAVFDSTQPLTEEDTAWLTGLDASRTVAIVNKTDLEACWDSNLVTEQFPHSVLLSAATGDGLTELQKAVENLLGTGKFEPSGGALFTERQRDEVRRALSAIQEAKNVLSLGLTLDAVTVCIDDALNALYELTGERTSDEIIDRVFETFCVGK